eukprot:UN32705
MAEHKIMMVLDHKLMDMLHDKYYIHGRPHKLFQVQYVSNHYIERTMPVHQRRYNITTWLRCSQNFITITFIIANFTIF